MHKATVAAHTFEVDDKGQDYILATFEIQDLAGARDTITSRIYLTDASMGIARNRLKVMGFDVDARSVQELQDNPILLAGHEVELLVTQNGSYMNVEKISAPRKPKEASFISQLDKALRDAKGKKKDASAPAGAFPDGSKANDKSIPF